MNPASDDLLSPAQIAEELGLSLARCYQLARLGFFGPATVVGGGSQRTWCRYERAHVDRFQRGRDLVRAQAESLRRQARKAR